MIFPHQTINKREGDMKPVVCVCVVGSPTVLVAPGSTSIQCACTCVSIVAAILYRSVGNACTPFSLDGVARPACVDGRGREGLHRLSGFTLGRPT